MNNIHAAEETGHTQWNGDLQTVAQSQATDPVGQFVRSGVPQQQQIQRNQSSVQDYELNGLLTGLPDPAVNAVDGFPFEGFNVEDLWDWMLYYDDPLSMDVP